MRADAGRLVSEWLADRYRHSDAALWQQRIAGELDSNGVLLGSDRALQGGEALRGDVRPGWRSDPRSLGDDPRRRRPAGNQPSGLPVIPVVASCAHAHGLARTHRCAAGAPPGRFTSGLQVCTRTRKPAPSGRSSSGLTAAAAGVSGLESAGAGVGVGAVSTVSSDVVERPHPLLGWIWGRNRSTMRRLANASRLTLNWSCWSAQLGDRVQVTITTGRPRQIRIHLAQLGSPLLGDPLYLPDREISATAAPGDGGYQLPVGLKTAGLALQCSLSLDWDSLSLRHPSLKGCVIAHVMQLVIFGRICVKFIGRSQLLSGKMVDEF